MKNKCALVIVIIVAAFVATIALLVGLTYYSYDKEMTAIKERLSSGSEILVTEECNLEYAIAGAGTPVLVLHGAGGGYDQGLWSAKIALGDGYKVIAVSRYGYLRTPLPKTASIKGQAAMYKELLDHLNISKIVVIGVSAGGPSAIQFANDYPERTSALILLSAVSMGRAPGDQDTLITDIIHLIQQSDYAYWLVSKYMRPTFLEFLGIPSPAYASFSAEQKSLSQEMLDTMHPSSQKYKGTMNDGKMIDRGGISSSSIVSPALIMHARDDSLVSYSHAENSHRLIPQSRLILFDTGGHAMLSQMDKVKDDVKQFLKDSPDSN